LHTDGKNATVQTIIHHQPYRWQLYGGIKEIPVRLLCKFHPELGRVARNVSDIQVDRHSLSLFNIHSVQSQRDKDSKGTVFYAMFRPCFFRRNIWPLPPFWYYKMQFGLHGLPVMLLIIN